MYRSKWAKRYEPRLDTRSIALIVGMNLFLVIATFVFSYFAGSGILRAIANSLFVWELAIVSSFFYWIYWMGEHASCRVSTGMKTGIGIVLLILHGFAFWILNDLLILLLGIV